MMTILKAMISQTLNPKPTSRMPTWVPKTNTQTKLMMIIMMMTEIMETDLVLFLRLLI